MEKIKINNFNLLEIKTNSYFFKKILFVLLLVFITVSCDDLFVRFKYETIECKKNSFNLNKISIRDDSVGSFADVEFGDYYHKIEIYENDDDSILLLNDDIDLEIRINKSTDILDVRMKNIIKKLDCKKSTFKM